MKSPLPHVCFVAPNAFPLLAGDAGLEVIGGAELQQVTIARGLVRRGYRVSMICLDFGQPDGIEVDGIVVHRAYAPAAGWPVIRFAWPRLTSLWSCLTRADADIYYQRAAAMVTGLLALHARRHGRKSVFAVAGDPMIRFARDRMIYEYGVRHVDSVVVQNPAQQRMIEERFGRHGVLIPNCYDAEPESEHPVAADVLWVSTIRRIKRPELFLELARALPAHRFTMIGGPGEGEESLYAEVRARSHEIPNLRFTGFLPYAEAARHFDGARVFVNTSESEGFPNTFLQAWARAVPTVSFIDCGALLGGEPGGQVTGSLAEMTAAVGRLLDDEAERARLGAAGRAYVAAHHSTERVLDRYDALFRRLLEPEVRPARGWAGAGEPGE